MKKKAPKAKAPVLHSNVIQKVGSWGFLAGVILAIILGISGSLASNGVASLPTITWMTSLLIIVGLIVGFLNVTSNETNQFLFATLVLVVISGLGGNMLGQINAIGTMLKSIFSAILLFVVPATLIVSLKAVVALAKE